MGKINEYKEYLSIEEAVKSAVKYCIEHDVLKEFLLKNASEVANMLFDEMSTEEIAAVRYEEGLTEASLAIARNLLSEGLTPEFVHRTTGLSLNEIEKLHKTP